MKDRTMSNTERSQPTMTADDDEFAGLNPGGGGGDAYQHQYARKRQDVAILEPRFVWDPMIGEKFSDLQVNEGSWQALIDTIWPSAKTLRAVTMALAYCKARKLDPFKRVVHIVPMWHSAIGREVETVWPGIAELRTTAFRTGQFFGMDEPEFGPMVKKTFTGSITRDRKVVELSIEVEFPEWCRIKVKRLLGGQVGTFVGPKVMWLEAYASIGRSDLPNSMWQERPVGQVEKCAEAGALRRAFPEEIGSDYSSEEMAGKLITTHGLEALRASGNYGGEEGYGEPINALAAKEVSPRASARRAARNAAMPSATRIENTLDELPISVRAANALKAAGLTEVEQIEAMTWPEIMRIPGLGVKGATELRDCVTDWRKEKAGKAQTIDGEAKEAAPAETETVTSIDATARGDLDAYRNVVEETIAKEPPPAPPPPPEANKPSEASLLLAKFQLGASNCLTQEALQEFGLAWRDQSQKMKSGTDEDKACAESMYAAYKQRQTEIAAEDEKRAREEAERQTQEQPQEPGLGDPVAPLSSVARPAQAQPSPAEAKPQGDLLDSPPAAAAPKPEAEKPTKTVTPFPKEIENKLAAVCGPQCKELAEYIWAASSRDDASERYEVVGARIEYQSLTSQERMTLFKVVQEAKKRES